MRRKGASERYAQEHWCLCAGVAVPLRKPPIAIPPSAPSPATASPSPPVDTLSKSGAPLKRSQSTLTTWLAAVRPKERDSRNGGLPDIPGRGVCCGTIEVGAVTDFSHPLARKGIKGQRVTVCVRHREGPP